jgi:hypothetical protein
MWKRVLGGILGLVVALGGMFGIATVLTKGTRPKQPTQPAVRYLAEAELPNDAAAEKRRDFAVLEAALNDFESRNPTHDKSGSPVKVIVNHKTSPSGPFLSRIAEPIGRASAEDGDEVPNIPKDALEDLDRRRAPAAISLADFKPANPSIIVDNLDAMLGKSESPLDAGVAAIFRKYPPPARPLWPRPPGYSKDGNSAIVIFGLPMGVHGADWVYLLSRKGTRWVVQWRRLQLYR